MVDTPVGDDLLGRVVDSLGFPIDAKGDIEAQERRPVKTKLPVMARKSVHQPLFTG